MSRFGIELTIVPEKESITDDNAIMGYDDNLETWFLQAFETYDEDNDCEEILLWLGKSFKEYDNINDLINILNKSGAKIEFISDEERALFEKECKHLNQTINITHDVF